MLNIAKKLFGSSNDRRVKRHMDRVARIVARHGEIQALTDEELRRKTLEFRERHAGGESLDSLLEEAFAVVREGATRALGQTHYEVQLVGGMVLHEGDIAEMRTGEGKTLVATLPVYLNAIADKGVHVVTVNDYLARRDAEWMGKVYSFLGLTTGVVVHGLDDAQRRAAYAADVTYGTNNEFGFDYLRDNMKYSLEEMVQRGHNFAIVDEVDSILIDEARTPLIISGPTEDRSDFYRTIDEVVRNSIEDEHFELDEKQRSVTLTEEGNEHIEEVLQEQGLLDEGGLYDVGNVSVVHHVNQALRAHKLFFKDQQYIVKGGAVVLIDEFTGRMMEGRRLSEGLHQAIEAKEHVEIKPENVTLASITFQNYFRLYDKLAGMTGTAITEEAEFQDIYGLSVVEIPTNRPIQRIDDDDEVYRTVDEKHRSVMGEIAAAHLKNQPVLVGTASIERSEQLSALLSNRKVLREAGEEFLKRAENYKDNDPERERCVECGEALATVAKTLKQGVPHAVLNARFHEQEAAIVAQAGIPGGVTIATNMAGRGTDIQLGGNPDMMLEQWREEREKAGDTPTDADIAAKEAEIKDLVAKRKAEAKEAGGLYVIGSERHESRRIDNQLRGRTGRQGDQGRSKFFVSVEDDLLRIFAADRLDQIMRMTGMKEGEAIVHPWMSKALERSQKRVEQRNFDIRKNILKYDDVINDQRKAIFEQRIDFMQAEELSEVVEDMRRDVVEALVTRHIPPKAYAEQWDTEGLYKECREVLGLDAPIAEWAAEEGIADEEMRDRLERIADESFAKKAAELAPDVMRRIEKQVVLQIIDQHWREHIQQLDQLRSVIHLRGYAQRDPLNEFKTEAFSLFEKMLSDLRMDVTRILMNLRVETQAPPPPPEPPKEALPQSAPPQAMGQAVERGSVGMARGPAFEPVQRDPNDPSTWGRVGRNELCPCGSGKKYKHCHGAVTVRA